MIVGAEERDPAVVHEDATGGYLVWERGAPPCFSQKSSELSHRAAHTTAGSMAKVLRLAADLADLMELSAPRP